MTHPLAAHYRHDPPAARARLLGLLNEHGTAAGASTALSVEAPCNTLLVYAWCQAWGIRYVRRVGGGTWALKKKIARGKTVA